MDYLIRIVNRKDHKGEKGEYIARPSPLGNPFTIKQHGREKAIELYKDWLNLQWTTGNQVVIKSLETLARKLKKDGEIILECWCAPEHCHGEIIGKALLNIIEKNLLSETQKGG